ncbi:MAG: Maf family protein [Clostridiales bacterium]|nr:Maf family protein [Clostridiales bacterium]
MRLLLASASPRRRELLAQTNLKFDIVPSAFEETAEGLSAYKMAICFAEGKAKDVFAHNRDCAVLGADTVVALNGEIFGKPKSAEDAKEMLRLLSGKTHSVYTGVCLVFEGFVRSFCEETKVTFNEFDEDLISRYVASGLCFGKAGAYGIQDGYPLVKSFEGSYSNVVGLPVERVSALFREVHIC